MDWKQDPNERLKLFTDVSFGNEVSKKRSTSGEIIFLNAGPISWFARLQKLVALSTAESEIYAAIARGAILPFSPLETSFGTEIVGLSCLARKSHGLSNPA